MLWYHYVFGAVLIVFSIVITIVVLMQVDDCYFLRIGSCCIPCFSFYRIRIKMINLA